MKNIIIDTVNYDYPSCGGITVTKGRKHYTVEVSSNYQGNITGARVQVPITDARDQWDADDWSEVVNTILYEGTDRIYTDCRILSHGHRVQ
jgi:hypothetical protein